MLLILFLFLFLFLPVFAQPVNCLFSDDLIYFWLQLQTTTESLSSQLESAEARLKMREEEHTSDLESALIKLEEEQQR